VNSAASVLQLITRQPDQLNVFVLRESMMNRFLTLAAIAVLGVAGALTTLCPLPVWAQTAIVGPQETLGTLAPPLSQARKLFYSQNPQALKNLLAQLPRVPQGMPAARSPAVAPPASGTWTPTTNPPPASGMSNPMVLTDGTVVMYATCTGNWYRLTPDPNSTYYNTYINGTWTTIASLPSGYQPRFFASAVLPDGRFIVEGGEYNNPVDGCHTPSADTTLGAIYDPLTNHWTAVTPPSGWAKIGDASSILLATGTYMLSNCCTAQDALLNPANLTWTPTGTGKIDGDNNEEGWTPLPNGNVLTVDVYESDYPNCPSGANPFRSEVYNPSTGGWSDAGSTIVKLPDCGPPNQSFEMGPQILRPDGTVVAFGATTSGVANTSIYDSTSGTWTAGPTLPVVLGVDYNLADAPAAILNNGNILFAASPGLFQKPVHFFEFSAAPNNTITQVGDTTNAANVTSFQVNFVVLPTGQILQTDLSGTVEIYQANGGFNSSWAPVIDSVPTNLGLGDTYHLGGTQLSGLSQGAAYGDDVQANTNFPLVIIENLATTHTFYARTFGWTTSVAPGAVGAFAFTVPASMETGPSSLFVIANGIYSTPTSVTIGPHVVQNTASHDFNSSGTSDVLFRDTNSPTVGEWLMNGNTIVSGIGVGALPSNWSIVGTGDFNGDGTTDILIRDSNSNTVGIWFMNGGSIQSAVGVGVLPGNWSIVGTGDFNYDGKTDILIRDSNTNTVGIWFMNGGSVQSAQSVGVLPANWSIVGTGDFNGDGKTDILIRDSNSNTVAMWLMNGNMIAAAVSVGVLPGNWSIVGTGDFNGDAKSDILLQDSNSNTVGVWLMNGNMIQSALSVGVLPSNWKIIETGDLNGDRKSDILLQDSNSNTVGVWLMNGNIIQSALSIGVLPGNWKIQSLNTD
jgi:hypothetical protein